MLRKISSLAIALSMLFGVGASHVVLERSVASVFADETATTGTLAVNQAGALGTVEVVGPSTASVATETYSNASAAVGSYSITVTPPTGFVLDNVKDGANVVLESPYTQVLAEGATLTFNVNFVAAPVVPPVTPPTSTEITKAMISAKTKLCAAMKGSSEKRLCMRERNQMKRDFQKQEKLKREKAREEAKKKREEEKRARKEALKARLEARKAKLQELREKLKAEKEALKAEKQKEKDNKNGKNGKDDDDENEED